MDQWYYRMFGEEFGPVSFERLKEMADANAISEFDDVRSVSSNHWMTAGALDGLGLRSNESGSVAIATSDSDPNLNTMSIQSGFDEWYCILGGQELGPLGIDDLVQYAQNEQLGADDEVKLGKNGKWRRVGSIGRLVSVLPFQPGEKKIVRTPLRPKASAVDNSAVPFARKAGTKSRSSTIQAAVEVPNASGSYEEIKARIAQSMVAHAENYKAAEELAMARISWALDAGVDRNWWGRASGVEFGPVNITHVLGLARSGQLKPNDLVRNGQHGEYGPSSKIPGLFNAVAMMAKAAEALALAKSQAKQAIALAAKSAVAPEVIAKPAPVVVAPVAESPVAVVPVVAAPIQVAAPSPRPDSNPTVSVIARSDESRSNPQVSTRTEKPRPAPAADESMPAYTGAHSDNRPSAYASPTGGGYSSSMSTMSSYGSQRPVAYPTKRTAPKSYKKSDSSWFSDLKENLKEPKAIGSICAIAVVLLVAGWQYLPKSRAADVKRFHALKDLLDEFRGARVNPSSMAALQPKAQALSKEITAALKNKASGTDPTSQNLLWLARDEVPRLFQPGIDIDQVEGVCVMRLKEAAYQLGLEPRSPVDPTQMAQFERDD